MRRIQQSILDVPIEGQSEVIEIFRNEKKYLRRMWLVDVTRRTSGRVSSSPPDDEAARSSVKDVARSSDKDVSSDDVYISDWRDLSRPDRQTKL